jgi:hypothetical protein
MTSDRAQVAPLTIDDAFTALRLALTANARDATLPRAWPPLETVCRFAREKGITPEHLLIQLKCTMNEVPGLESHAMDQYDTRTRLVSMAIDAYFAE